MRTVYYFYRKKDITTHLLNNPHFYLLRDLNPQPRQITLDIYFSN